MPATFAQHSDTLSFKDKQVLLKTLIYLKLSAMGVTLPESDINVLSLFIINDNKEEVIQKSLDKGFVKSWQSGENTISKLVKLKLLQKKGIKKREVNPSILPAINTDYIAATVKIHNVSN